jgi:hypothetical protein
MRLRATDNGNPRPPDGGVQHSYPLYTSRWWTKITPLSNPARCTSMMVLDDEGMAI